MVHKQVKNAHQQAQLALEDSEQCFRNLVENILSGVLIIRNQELLYQNTLQKEQFGPITKAVVSCDYSYLHADDFEKTNWVRNSTLVDYLKEIKSKHTLLISDACFGGSIFSMRSAFGNQDKAFEKLYELPSRKAMTSGRLEMVPDRSSFTHYLLQRLRDNKETYLSSEQLYSSFRLAVINNSDAIPQFGEIENVGDEGGDFIFLKK